MKQKTRDKRIKKNRHLSDNLRKLRKRSGLSQEKLCTELQLRGCDISRSTYAKYENEIGNIEIQVIVALKNFYNCDYAEFFEGIEINDEED